MRNHIVLDIERSADDGDLAARIQRHQLDFNMVYAPNSPLRESEWSRWTSVLPGYLRAARQALAGKNNQDRLIFMTAGLALVAAVLCASSPRKRPEISTLNFIYRRRAGALGKIIESLVKQVLHRFAFVGVPSQEALAHYRECFPKAGDRIAFFPTWCGFPEEPPAVAPSVTIFSGGRSMRDYATLLEALSRLDVSAHLVANRTAFEGMTIPERVKVHFDVSHDLFARLMMQAAVVAVPLHPVRFDAGQSVVLQAMCYGKPVVASNAAGLAEYVEHGRTGLLVPPANAPALAEAINFVLENQSQANAMGAAARAAYHERYSRDAFVRRLGALFAET